MKLVIATPLYPPEIGGPATYAKLLEEGLPEKGIDVELVKFSAVRHLPKIIRHFVYFLRVRRALARADVALALDGVSVGLPTYIASWILRKPFVVKIVGDYAWEQGQQRFGITASLDEFVRLNDVPLAVRFLRTIQTGVAKRARLVIVPSEYLKGIVATWGLSVEKIQVIYNSVQKIKEAGSVHAAVSDLPSPLVVTGGRLVHWKNIDSVIDACARVPGVSLAIVGDGPERARLSARADEKLKKNVTFTGVLAHKDILAVMRIADIFVLNSSYEGLSHMLIEAQALGVPTIATNIGGNPEVITDGEGGILIPEKDTQALERALSRMLGDSKLYASMSKSAYNSSKRFSQDAMLEAVAKALTLLIK